jgi:hypothetical protein
MHPSDDPNWERILSDEFEQPELDQNIWNTKYYYGQTNDGNQEQQYYVPDSLSFANGQLRLTATYNPIEGDRPIPTPTGYQYHLWLHGNSSKVSGWARAMVGFLDIAAS